MQVRNKIGFLIFSIMLAGGLWLPLKMTVHAEEVEVPGYYEYIETEEESIVHWYGVARGTYLKEGICGIKDAGKGKVSVSGTTLAHVVCDTVKVGVYLDESSDGGKSFGQIGSYYFSESNTSSCHGSKTSISVTSGRWYMARGGHSATKNSKTETTSTYTGALKAS